MNCLILILALLFPTTMVHTYDLGSTPVVGETLDVMLDIGSNVTILEYNHPEKYLDVAVNLGSKLRERTRLHIGDSHVIIYKHKSWVKLEMEIRDVPFYKDGSTSKRVFLIVTVGAEKHED